MIKQLIILMLFVSMANAQTKNKNTGKGKVKPAVTDTSLVAGEPERELDEMEQLELTLPLDTEIDGLTGKTVIHKNIKIKNDSARAVLRAKMKKDKMTFRVYTKKPKKPTEKMQLCINIVAKDTCLLYCLNDTICKDPEVSKLLFQKSIGDTTYMLIFVEAFTKSDYRGNACSGGKETKLFFVRWNAPKGKAIWKTKTINSCIKTITNMTKTPIVDWDKESILIVSYHKAENFIDIKFDPAHPELGMQSVNDGESK